MPSAMAQVLARLELSNVSPESSMVGRLWDISQKGGCIAVPGVRLVQIPTSGQLHIHDPMTHEQHLLRVDLRWRTALSHTTFIGLMFVGGVRPRQTFLASYMRASWTDAVPRSRIDL